MKLFFITLISFFTLNTYSQKKEFDLFFEQVDVFMNMYVQDGLVDYDNIKINKMHLDSLTQFIASANVKNELDESYKKAFLINSYNLLVIKTVIENSPINSPMEVGGFFKEKKHLVANYGKVTLNSLENDLIRKPFSDPRIHFVLVCAGKGCPPIIETVYLPNILNEQLEFQTRKALSDSNFIRVNSVTNKVGVSEIFKWYTSDFKNKETASVIDFINKYRNTQIPNNYKLYYYPYDWSLNVLEEKVIIHSVNHSSLKEKHIKSNIQAYTPSKLLKKGQVEVQLFNNIYTQTAFRNDKREEVNLNNRSTYFGGLLYALYGVSKKGKINIGFDINVKSVLIDNDEKSSPFNILQFKASPQSRTEITSIGPKVKISPFKKANITIQSAFWIPIAKNLEADYPNDNGNFEPWLDYDRYTWWTQFFYDKSLNNKFQLFLETDLLFRFGKGKNAYQNGINKQSTMSIPTSGFISFFPTSKSTIYSMIQFSPTFNLNKYDTSNELKPDFEYANDYAQAGIGGKYQLSKNLSLEVSYTNFFIALNGGAGQTFNFGIRFLK